MREEGGSSRARLVSPSGRSRGRRPALSPAFSRGRSRGLVATPWIHRCRKSAPASCPLTSRRRIRGGRKEATEGRRAGGRVGAA